MIIVGVETKPFKRIIRYRCPICGHEAVRVKRLSNMKVVCFKCSYDLLMRLDRYAKKKGMSRSDVIRDAIRSYLGAEEKIRVKRVRLE